MEPKALTPVREPRQTPTQRALSALTPNELTEVELYLSTIASRNTREAYARDIGAYCQWLADTFPDDDWSLIEANTTAAANWTRAQLDGGAASASVARRQSALASFYRWGLRAGRFGAGRPNPFAADYLDRVTASSEHVDALTGTDVARLLAAAEGGPFARRDWCLVVLLASAGIRVSELCDATHADLVPVAGGHELTVRGKGRKIRRVALAPALCSRLLLGVEGRPGDGPLLLSNAGEKLNRHQVRRILARLAASAGLARLTPHMLRATFITEALSSGAELWAVQDAAGHADSRQTRAYQRRKQGSAAKQAMATQVFASYVEAIQQPPDDEQG